MTSTWTDLLKAFNAQGVRYLLIGGHAVMHYTEPRFTKDLDLWVETSADNGRAVFAALKSFGAPLSGLSPEDFSREGHFYSMGAPPLRVDVMMDVTGVSFADAWDRREETVFEGISVAVISRRDLITAKRAAGRRQDIVDAEALERDVPDSEH